jgi:type IV pilus assembly protein PilC
MAEFAYRARDSRGGSISGVLSAPNQDELVRQLRQQGLAIMSVVLRSKGSALGELSKMQLGKPRVKQADVVHFANQLAVMVDTGVPLVESLETLAQQTGNPTFREIVQQVAADVQGGLAFSEAIEKHPKYFNNMFVSLVHAGESSGNLGAMLINVSDYLVESYETQRRIKGALAYPMFLMGLAVVVVVVLMTFVLPKFTKIYEDKGATLPLPTQILLNTSKFLTGHWLAILIVLAAATTAAVLFFRSPRGRRFWDTLKIRTPIIGGVCRKLYIARAFRALGTMVAAGVPVISALEIARRTAANSHFVEVFNRAIAKVSEGETLSDQFFCSNLIPVATAQMIFAGEKSGRLGEVLLRLSNFCDRELKDAIKSMTTMLEPLLIGIMGFFIGGIAIALLMPMLTISKVIAK